MFQTKVVEKIKTHIVFNNFFPENRAVYEIMWKNTVERGRAQMTIWRMHIACSIPKDTNTHSEYVILIALHGNNGYANAPQFYVSENNLSCTEKVFSVTSIASGFQGTA